MVVDATGQALAYVYFEEEPGRRAAAHLLTRDEARRIAVNIAKLPDLYTEAVRPEATTGLPWPGAGHPRTGRRPGVLGLVTNGAMFGYIRECLSAALEQKLASSR